MRTRQSGQLTGFHLAESCRCTTGANESWQTLEAYPEHGWAASPPAFLADSEDWNRVYQAGVSYQDGVRMMLGPEGESLTDPEVDQLLERITDSMEPADAAEFIKGLGRALSGALPVLGQVAKTALPIVGGAVGSIVAPGIGTALGGALGGAAANLVGQATARRPAPPRPRPPMPAMPGHAMPGPAMAGPGMAMPRMPMPAMAPPQAGAAQQLLGLLNNPQLLGGLANAALGGAGAMPGGGAALGPLLGSLARLAEDAAAEVAGETFAESTDADSTGILAHRLVEAVQGARR